METHTDTSQMRSFKTMIDKATQDAVNTAMMNAAELSNTMLDAVEERLRGISTPIMTVKIKDLKEIKLDKPAAAILPKLIQLIEAREAVYLKGPAGCGKTTAVQQAAQVLETEFYHFVFAPDMGTTSVFGRQTVNGFVDSCIVKAAKNGGLLFLDELDNAAPETLVSLNGLGDKSGTLYNSVTGELIKIHEKFRLVAAGNTFGLGADHVYTARSRQDAASLSRFCVLNMDYDEKLELAISKSLAHARGRVIVENLHTSRHLLRKHNASEIISTRHIERVLNLICNLGWSDQDALAVALTASWPEGLAKQVGLDKKLETATITAREL